MGKYRKMKGNGKEMESPTLFGSFPKQGDPNMDLNIL